MTQLRAELLNTPGMGCQSQSKLRGPDIISGQFGVGKSKGRIGKGSGAVIWSSNVTMLNFFEPLLKVLKLEKIETDNYVFRLHYKVN